jgi:hypothetical protein
MPLITFRIGLNGFANPLRDIKGSCGPPNSSPFWQTAFLGCLSVICRFFQMLSAIYVQKSTRYIDLALWFWCDHFKQRGNQWRQK